MLIADGPVPVLPTPVAHRDHRAGKAAFGRDLPDHVLAVPRPSPDMGQAEEVEVGPIRFRMTRALCHLWAEIDEVCLVEMERESVAKARGGEELRRLRPAAIDVPADQILAAGRGHVMAGGRP